MAANNVRELQQRAEQGLMEIAGLISKREYNLSMVRSRQFMERLIRDYAEDASLTYTDLADAIEQLYQARRLTREQRDAFHNIRIIGNKAVHEGDSDPQDAQDAYYLLKGQLEAYLNAKARHIFRIFLYVIDTFQKKLAAVYNSTSFRVIRSCNAFKNI